MNLNNFYDYINIFIIMVYFIKQVIYFTHKNLSNIYIITKIEKIS